MSLARHATAVALLAAASNAMAQVGTLNSAPDSDLLAQEEASARDTARKQELISAVLSARETASGRKFSPALRGSLTAKLSSVPTLALESFANAGGLGDIDALVRDAVGPKVLGASAADLVFTPVTPCRIVNTVATATALAANTSRAFYVNGNAAAVFEAQGGNAGGCGIPDTATAVEMNFIAVGPAGPGDLRAFPWAASPTEPLASVINYSNLAGLNIANGLAQPVCDASGGVCTFDLIVKADVATSHVIIDVVGYYNRADVTVLTRAISAQPFLNTTTTPVTNNLITGVIAPTAGGLLVNVSFTCVSFTGTTDTRWDIQPRVNAVNAGTSMPLYFPHAAVASTPGDSATSTFFQPVAAGTHTISYTASRSPGDGSLDCNLHASSLFVPFNNAGGTP